MEKNYNITSLRPIHVILKFDKSKAFFFVQQYRIECADLGVRREAPIKNEYFGTTAEMNRLMLPVIPSR